MAPFQPWLSLLSLRRRRTGVIDVMKIVKLFMGMKVASSKVGVFALLFCIDELID